MKYSSNSLSRIIEIPALEISESMMFGYPTRMIDAWNPSAEKIVMPGFTNKARKVRLEINPDGLTYAKLPKFARLGFWPRFKREVRQKIGDQGQQIDVKDKIVVDFRTLDTGNVAHFAHGVMLPLHIIKTNMDNIDLEKDILCVFAKRPNKLTQRLIGYFRLNAIFSDSPIRGCIASLDDIDNDRRFLSGAIPLLAKYPIPNYNEHAPRKVFISRKGSRIISNEGEVSDCLNKLGYETKYFEDLEFCDQFSIGRNATDVVAIHGAALGTLAFNNTIHKDGQKLRLIELFSPAFVVNPFRQYAAALNGKWAGVRGQITPQIIKDLDGWKGVNKSVFQPFTVDLSSLKFALDYINE